jgi:adenylate kinase
MLQEILNSKGLGYKYLCIGKLVNEKKLYKTYNKEFDVPEFDEDMVCEEIKQDMEARNNIVEFHSSAFFPEDWFDLVVLLRTNNTILYDRLKARNYVEKKISENIECEIMEVCAEEVRDSYKEEAIIEVENNVMEQLEANVKKVSEIILKS